MITKKRIKYIVDNFASDTYVGKFYIEDKNYFERTNETWKEETIERLFKNQKEGMYLAISKDRTYLEWISENLYQIGLKFHSGFPDSYKYVFDTNGWKVPANQDDVEHQKEIDEKVAKFNCKDKTPMISSAPYNAFYNNFSDRAPYIVYVSIFLNFIIKNGWYIWFFTIPYIIYGIWREISNSN